MDDSVTQVTQSFGNPVLTHTFITFTLVNPELVRAAAQAVIAAEPEITSYDTILGDGDCGLTLKAAAAGICLRGMWRDVALHMVHPKRAGFLFPSFKNSHSGKPAAVSRAVWRANPTGLG